MVPILKKCNFDLSSVCIIYNARYAFLRMESNKLSSQIQIQSDDENLDVMRNKPHYVEPYLAEMKNKIYTVYTI